MMSTDGKYIRSRLPVPIRNCERDGLNSVTGNERGVDVILGGLPLHFHTAQLYLKNKYFWLRASQ